MSVIRVGEDENENSTDGDKNYDDDGGDNFWQ